MLEDSKNVDTAKRNHPLVFGLGPRDLCKNAGVLVFSTFMSLPVTLYYTVKPVLRGHPGDTQKLAA